MRGILYLIWKGPNDPTEVLKRSIASVKHWHPELPYKVVELPADSTLLCKSQMYDLSPFDETLFLDADTTVMGKLDYGFIQAEKHGIACCISANPWNRRYYALDQQQDAVEYSSGVVFFDKGYDGGHEDLWGTWHSHSTRDVFSKWLSLDGTDTTCSYFEAAGKQIFKQPVNDQALFSLAMAQLNFNPFVLPMNWNIYPRWQKYFCGELKIWHGYDDIPPTLLEWNADQSRTDAVIKFGAL